MSNIQAAIGCAQLERVDDLVSRKREILQIYKRELSDIRDVHLNSEPPETINGAWMPTVVFPRRPDIHLARIQAAFLEEDIDARVFFHPLSSLPMFQENRQNINAYDIQARAINLPSYHDMTLDEQLRVIKVVRGLARG
jgi:perosamine synthetase